MFFTDDEKIEPTQPEKEKPEQGPIPDPKLYQEFEEGFIPDTRLEEITEKGISIDDNQDNDISERE